MVNSLIKVIRENRGLSKKDVYDGIIAKKTYNNIEEDVNVAKLEDLLLILERLDLSFKEFSYLYSRKTPTENDVLQEMRTIFISSNQDGLNKLLSKYKKANFLVYHLLLSFKSIHDDKLNEAKTHAAKIWNVLKSYDNYYPMDVFYLSHIFYIFPFEEGINMINILKAKLAEYSEFESFYITEINFYLNAGRYLLQESNYFKESVDCFDKALQLAKMNDSAKLTGIALIRLGDLRNDEEMISQGQTILELFDKELSKVILDDLHFR